MEVHIPLSQEALTSRSKKLKGRYSKMKTKSALANSLFLEAYNENIIASTNNVFLI